MNLKLKCILWHIIFKERNEKEYVITSWGFPIWISDRSADSIANIALLDEGKIEREKKNSINLDFQLNAFPLTVHLEID